MALDDIDRRLLAELQLDASESLEKLGERVGLSRNACWNRVRRLEEAGILKARVALVDPAKINLGLSVFIAVKTNEHDQAWSDASPARPAPFPKSRVSTAHRAISITSFAPASPTWRPMTRSTRT